MKKVIAGVVGLCLVIAICRPAGAEPGAVALVGSAGLRGLGGELVVGVTDYLNVRGGLSGFKYSYSATEDDIRYDLDLDLLTASGVVDWHMLQGGFRLTGGFMLNKNKLDLKAEPQGTYDIGDNVYTGAEVGTLTGRVDFNDVAAYLGFGWGNPVEKDKKLGFSVDLGAMFQGSANVDLSASGIVANDPGFQNDLAREESNTQDDLKPFKYYPVLTIGLTYRIR